VAKPIFETAALVAIHDYAHLTRPDFYCASEATSQNDVHGVVLGGSDSLFHSHQRDPETLGLKLF
jgi:hypothetical protein